jgi:hypothetical protein
MMCHVSLFAVNIHHFYILSCFLVHRNLSIVYTQSSFNACLLLAYSIATLLNEVIYNKRINFLRMNTYILDKIHLQKYWIFIKAPNKRLKSEQFSFLTMVHHIWYYLLLGIF